ncbi:MAG: GHKL domain-containing protein [Clostridiaceae bacterium]|nr:GHKL domain-containing protein [Clostridiaceae bacterium]
MIIEYIKQIPLSSLIISTFFVILCQISISWKDNRKKIIFAIFTMGLLPIIPTMHGFPYRMLLSHINDIIWLKLLFRKSLKDIVVPYYVAFIFIVLVEIPTVSVIMYFIPTETAKLPYNLTVFFSITLFLNVSLLCWILPIGKFYIKYKFVLDRYLPILLILPSTLYFLNILMYTYDSRIDIPTLILVLLMTIIIFSFLQVMREEQEEKLLIQNYEQQKSLVFPLIDEIRSKQHDFKNHITTIYGFSQQNHSDTNKTIQDYIENLNNHLKDIDLFLHVKNKVISGILYSKQCEAELKDIDLHLEIPPYEVPFPLADYEYVAVLGNILDNAFEVPMNSDNEKKKIIFKLIDNSDSSILEIWNNGIPIHSKDMSNLFKKGYSTKESKSQRGYGLYNVKRIVDKHNGNIEILRQNNLTGFRICFPLN